LARGLTLENSVVAAKKYITGAIANSVRIGRKHHALGWFSA
jgi:hydroxymethylpyrimidine/phosphomethylpyrimidine kinase